MKFSVWILSSLFLSQSVWAGELIYLGKTQKSAQNITSSSLENAKAILGLEGEFRLLESKTSILETHFLYQQTLQGYDIEDSQIAFSVDKDSQIVKIYHSILPLRQNSDDLVVPLISENMAFELAWNDLKGSGDLLDTPKAKVILSKNLNLVYKVEMALSSPYGHWISTIDARTGEVLSQVEESLPRMKRAASAPAKIARALKPFASAAAKLESQKISKMLNVAFTTVNGVAQVFDPNPVATLGRADLRDSSPASAFTNAYVKETLNEISFNNGVYTLTGPKVTLLDFDSPKKAITTSRDGSWIFERGQSGFTDSMTYIHIDRSIRYLETIGFRAQRAVFKKSLEADSDGEDGADNSSYTPSSRRLSFGHGKVDDNEDADVILHELGHAIQHQINPSWSGGDTGAMGEGFGDYWAASYSADLPHGMDFHPEWVFKWDGHHAETWPGRKLDVLKLTYEPKQTYDAHDEIKPGMMSDELWSTPLFQAFLELRSKGVLKADIDRIIIEAHFGLGSGLTMPQMATAILKAAKALYPKKDYDQVFTRHFKNQKIL